jgi:hypothetical protein
LLREKSLVQRTLTFYKGTRENYLDCAERRPIIGNFSDALGKIGMVLKLYGVETEFQELPNLTRILTSVVVMANTSDEALQFAQHRYPEALAGGDEHRVVEVEHVFVNWPDDSVVIVEKRHSQQYHC